MDQINDIVDAIEELLGDNTVPKNVKKKLETISAALKEDGEDMSIRINKALSELDELSDDTNLESFTRTQIWNIASMLESI